MPYRLIDPQDDLDFTCDYGPFLDDSGSPSDTITSSVWEIDPGGSPFPELHDGTFTVSTATIWVRGAILGEVYLLTNRVVSAEGRTKDGSITLRCETR